MTVRVEMGLGPDGSAVALDLEELLATRLLVQGNSGSGKSHLLRRLLEKSAGEVQQIVIDPEGDFVTLADRYGHIAVEAAEHDEKDIARLAARIREHRASVVLSLEGLEAEAQMRCAAAFLGGLFDAPRDHWYPALVVVDEAQLFAPSGGVDVAEDVRRASLSAMTNLMCRGRKRGLAGVIATQRRSHRRQLRHRQPRPSPPVIAVHRKPRANRQPNRSVGQTEYRYSAIGMVNGGSLISRHFFQLPLRRLPHP